VSNPALAQRVRGLLVYIAAWSPLILLYTVLVGITTAQTPTAAVIGALHSVGWFAFLGLGVVAIGQRWEWPAKPTVSLFVAHVALALAYAGLWDLAVILDIADGLDGLPAALEIVRPWIFWQTILSMLLYTVVLGLTWARGASRRSRDAALRAQRAEALRVEAELAALRGQLDPHFLFNTLHSVSVLVAHDPSAAQRALEQLADLLRYVLDSKRGARDAVPLSEELAFVTDYLALESLRFGDRLRVQRDFSRDALACHIPSFALQTLVENAIKHAVAPRATGGTVALSGHLEGNALVLEIRDDGPGAQPSATTSGTGIGLDALRRRLTAVYGDAAALDLRSVPGSGYAVTMRVPA
jgi:two-component system, LytTR family, sensor kinase